MSEQVDVGLVIADITLAPSQPFRRCGLCKWKLLMDVVSGKATVCEYCDSPGGTAPPDGGFEGLDEEEAQ